MPNKSITTSATQIRTGRPLKPPHPSNRLGRQLRARRRALGITLKALGKTVGMSAGRIAGYELGTLVPGPKPLGKLATALGLDIHRLWRFRLSTLEALEWDKMIFQAQLRKRAAMAIAERGLEDLGDLRVRRLQPPEIP